MNDKKEEEERERFFRATTTSSHDFKKGGGGEKIRDKSFPPASRSSLRVAVFLLAHLSINNVL